MSDNQLYADRDAQNCPSTSPSPLTDDWYDKVGALAWNMSEEFVNTHTDLLKEELFNLLFEWFGLTGRAPQGNRGGEFDF